MIDLLIYVAIFAIIAITIWWVLSKVPIPEPLKTVLLIVLVVVGVIILVGVLLNFAHGGLSLRL